MSNHRTAEVCSSLDPRNNSQKRPGDDALSGGGAHQNAMDEPSGDQRQPCRHKVSGRRVGGRAERRVGWLARTSLSESSSS